MGNKNILQDGFRKRFSTLPKARSHNGRVDHHGYCASARSRATRLK
jgi:hypothetical protein